MGSADDDLKRERGFIVVLALPQRKTHLSAGVGDSDIAARVTLLGQLAGEEIVELCAEDTVGDELALLADLGGHFCLRRSLGGRRESARASVIQSERCPSSK